MPRVELLYWNGCPSHHGARSLIIELLAELARGPVQIEERLIVTSAEAILERFVGSPTFRVDGRDLFPTDAGPSLSCRVYRRHDGRPSPLPDRAELRNALREAFTAPPGPFDRASST